jgi:hypothetical protein
MLPASRISIRLKLERSSAVIFREAKRKALRNSYDVEALAARPALPREHQME